MMPAATRPLSRRVTTVPRAECQRISIEYQTFGSAEGIPTLLIMGLGASLAVWEEGFYGGLVDRGHYVILFDNRDSGRTTKIESGSDLDSEGGVDRWRQGGAIDAPYRLSDMAGDAVEFLDALEIEKAHVVGVSMGGMIAQSLAIEYGPRISSLCSIMSSTGCRDLPDPTPEALSVLVTPTEPTREAFIAQHLASNRVTGGNPEIFAFDEERLRGRAERIWEHGLDPDGTTRQMLATLASGDRSEELKKLDLPSLVVHGDTDTIFSIEHGQATLDAIPGATPLFIEGFGHDLHPDTDSRISDAIHALARETR